VCECTIYEKALTKRGGKDGEYVQQPEKRIREWMVKGRERKESILRKEG
jgi:hypothetical protein